MNSSFPFAPLAQQQALFSDPSVYGAAQNHPLLAQLLGQQQSPLVQNPAFLAAHPLIQAWLQQASTGAVPQFANQFAQCHPILASILQQNHPLLASLLQQGYQGPLVNQFVQNHPLLASLIQQAPFNATGAVPFGSAAGTVPFAPATTGAGVPFGAPLGQGPFLAQHAQTLQELVRDRQRDVTQDNVIQQLVDSARFSRRADHLIRHFIQGRPIQKDEIVRDLLSDRQKDQDIAKIVNFILSARKSRTIDDICAHLGAGVPLSPDYFAVKRRKQAAVDWELDQALKALLAKDFASLYGGASGIAGGIAGFPGAVPTANPCPSYPIWGCSTATGLNPAMGCSTTGGMMPSMMTGMMPEMAKSSSWVY